MSFFAGANKLHITQNSRPISELNTNNIYPDTTFHSNMNVICSTGEYTSQAYVANFTVKHGDYTDITISEQCYEAAIPQAVVNAIINNYVVLVQVVESGYESAVNFPINIKTSLDAGTSSYDKDYGVAVAPQITNGGRLDVCFSTNSINNRVIAPTLAQLKSGRWDPDTSTYVATRKVMPWSTNPDWPSNYPNTIRPGCKFIQMHFLGERWALENTTAGSPSQTYRRDNPYMKTLTQTAPKFSFIILNVKYTNRRFSIENPFPVTGAGSVKLESGKITVNNRVLNTIKLLQSRNADAIGEFNVSKTLNRVLPYPSVNFNSLQRTDLWDYKKYDSFIFSQGARYPNGALLLRPVTGGNDPTVKYSTTTNTGFVFNDTSYTSPPMTTSWLVGGPTLTWAEKISGTAINGASRYTYPDIYFTDTDKLLLAQKASQVSNGAASTPSPFALIDTSAFTGMYIDKDGIKGTYAGKLIPIYNNNSSPTYLIESMAFSNSSSFTMVSEGVLEFTQDLLDISLSRSTECLLVGVNITGGTLFNNYISWASKELGSGDINVSSDNRGCIIGDDPSAVTFGLVKLNNSEEAVLARGYLTATMKDADLTLQQLSQGSPYYDYIVSSVAYQIDITISLKRVGTALKVITRAVMEKGRRVNTTTGSAGYDNFTFHWVDAPTVNVAVTKIQS